MARSGRGHSGRRIGRPRFGGTGNLHGRAGFLEGQVVQALGTVCVGERHLGVAAPAFAEVAAEARGFDGEPPLVVVRRASDDGRFGDEAAANLADDAIERNAGEWADVFENEPRAGVLPHLLDHVFGEVLAAVFAAGGVAVDELAAGDAGDGLAMPGFVGERAEGAETGAGGNFEGVPAFREAVIELRRLGVGLGCVDGFSQASISNRWNSSRGQEGGPRPNRKDPLEVGFEVSFPLRQGSADYADGRRLV